MSDDDCEERLHSGPTCCRRSGPRGGVGGGSAAYPSCEIRLGGPFPVRGKRVLGMFCASNPVACDCGTHLAHP